MKIWMLVVSILVLAACNSTPPAPPDTDPDPFVFTDATGVEPNPVLAIFSNEITVSGINRPVKLRATFGTTVHLNGQYATYFEEGVADLEVVNGTKVKVAISPSNRNNDITETTVTIGGRSATFKVITKP